MGIKTYLHFAIAIKRISIITPDGCKKTMLDVNISIAIPEMYVQEYDVRDVLL